MNTYVADFWAINRKNFNIVYDTEYYCRMELYDSDGFWPWRISIKDGQFVLTININGSVSPHHAYLSGIRIWFFLDPKINCFSPFEIILKPEAEFDRSSDQIPFCNFCLDV